jgi:SAM-dependent methyltransferase
MTSPAQKQEGAERIRPYVEKARSSSGWSFPSIRTTRMGRDVPWDYEGRARKLLQGAGSVLDMGTGGGELYSDLLRGSRMRAVATEPWARNAPLANDRLRGIGCSVVMAHSLRLPFRDGAFSLVLNRHEELNPIEVARVLAREGRVFTQQVGRRNWIELRAFFPRMQDFGPLFEAYRRGFEAAGLSIARVQEHETQVAYAGLGDVVFMLCVAPWEIPGFSPLETDLDALLEMERSLLSKDGIVLTEDRFLIEAKKS